MEAGVELLVTLVGSLGFPIVCCYFLWKYINETMKEFTKIMQQNTMMISKLCDKIDYLDERGDKHGDSKSSV